MTQVSVIIPAYNGERYITAAVDSVLHQTYQDFEIIVVDDGSVDRTGAVLQAYGDRIHYVYQSNQGVAAARNRGLAIAQGKFIAFLDQDDVFLPDKLALQVACFEENPGAGIVHSGWRIVDQLGKTRSAVQPWQGLPVLDQKAWIEWKPVFLGAMLFQRHWLKHAEGFNLQLRQTDDVDLVLRLAALGCESTWLRSVVVNYRQHATNTSSNVMQQAQEIEQVLDRFFERSDLPACIRQLEKSSRYQSLVWCAWRLFQSKTDRTEVLRYLKKSLCYKPATITEAILDWSKQFATYSFEYGEEFNTIGFSQLNWQEMLTFTAFNAR